MGLDELILLGISDSAEETALLAACSPSCHQQATDQIVMLAMS